MQHSIESAVYVVNHENANTPKFLELYGFNSSLPVKLHELKMIYWLQISPWRSLNATAELVPGPHSQPELLHLNR